MWKLYNFHEMCARRLSLKSAPIGRLFHKDPIVTMVPPILYMTGLPCRSVRKHRIKRITVALFSFYLLQRVGGSVGLGVVSRWFQWLLILVVLARRRDDSVIADSFLNLGMLVVPLASARSPARWLEAACRALDTQKNRPCALREASPFSD